jgi:plastocyanin
MKKTSCALVLAAALCIPASTQAQSVMERTPNLQQGWVGPRGTVHFNFLHRFKVLSIDPPSEDRILNSPTFLLSYSITDMFMLGAHYASSSTFAPGKPNEYEVFARFAPLKPGSGLPVEVGITAAYSKIESFDAELAAGAPIGPLKLMGAFRVLSNGFGSDTLRMAVGGGARLRLTPNISLAGDVITPLSKRSDEVIGWGAGLQLGIPFSPHTLSLHAANTTTSTLQGSSRGVPGSRPAVGGTRWGFEFTIPITLSRYFGSGGGPVQDVTVTADTVRVPIRDLEFGLRRLIIRPGTTVIWVNEGAIPHTSTSDTGAWNSPMLQRGESYSRVFTQTGEFPYHCVPHPMMTAVVVVQAAN